LQDDRWRLGAASDGTYLDATFREAQSVLRDAATMAVTVSPSGTGKAATVPVINQTGHKLPTGYPEGRQMWIHLEAFDNDGDLVYASGAYDAGEHRLVRDADVQVFEAKQGISSDLADLLGQEPGESLAPLGTFGRALLVVYLQPSDRIVYSRTISLEGFRCDISSVWLISHLSNCGI
jgi:hypothetical protein